MTREQTSAQGGPLELPHRQRHEDGQEHADPDERVGDRMPLPHTSGIGAYSGTLPKATRAACVTEETGFHSGKVRSTPRQVL